MATITPVSQHDGAALTRASAGQRIMMDGGDTPLAALLQKLADRAEFAKDAAYAALQWSGRVDIDGVANTGAVGVTAGMIENVVVKDGSIWKRFTKAETALNIGAQVLSANAHYNVYVYVSGGALAYEVTTTVPNSSGMWKTGAADTHRFLFAFATGAGGVPLSGTLRSGRFIYRVSDLADTALRVLGGSGTGSATSYTAVDLSAFVPPHVRVALVRMELTPLAGVAGVGFGYLQTNGDAGSGAHLVSAPATVGHTCYGDAEIRTDADRQLQYKVSASDVKLSLFAYGYQT